MSGHRRPALLFPLAALLFNAVILAQEEAPVFQGNWTATAGTMTLRGAWSGQVLPGRTDAAHGSWTLDSDTGGRLMQGTWSAGKRRGRWEGTWSARTSQDRIFKGTWAAYMTGTEAETLADLLEATLGKYIAGTWRSAGRQGGWWLRAGEQR
jgi:hypothetical protein